MDMPRIERALLDHLRVEFGDHGDRAVGFLEAAQSLLDEGSVPVPKVGELAAFCIREALAEIPKASGSSDEGAWKRLSRAVVDAAERYRMAAELSSEDTTEALSELLAGIDELDSFHEEAYDIHSERLIALMIQRAGVEPLSSGTEPVHAYQKLVGRVNRALHGSCTVADARGYWLECVALLRKLFLLPELRHRELDELAARDAPSDADLAAVLNLVGTRVHLERFLRQIQSPRWLWLLDSSNVLNAGGNELWRPAGSAAVRLADTHRDEVLFWLTEMHNKHASQLERARCIAHAAYRLGGPALDVLLEIVCRYPADGCVVHTGVSAVLELDASDQMVADLADELMNETSWDLMIVAGRLVDHMADGVDERNALQRIKLLCFKLSKVPENDSVLRRLRYNRPGSIADGHLVFPDDRSSILLGCLTRMVRAAWGWVPATDLFESTSRLPAVLRGRLRAWILAHAPYIDPCTIAAELAQAIASRTTTGDDVGLVDRAVEICDRTMLRDRCETALGDAPTVRDVSCTLGSEQPPPERWMRARAWVDLLPADFTESWKAPYQVLAAKYGKLRREYLMQQDRVEAFQVGSPIDAEGTRVDATRASSREDRPMEAGSH